MSDAYRFDNRTKEQFSLDIKVGHEIERRLFTRWVEKLPGSPKWRNNGCSNAGDFLTGDMVTLDADFYVDDIGLVEVKFSRHFPKTFHIKCDQLEAYLKQGAKLLMFLGAEEMRQRVYLFTLDDLRYVKETCEVVSCEHFGSKLAYRIPVDMIGFKAL